MTFLKPVREIWDQIDEIEIDPSWETNYSEAYYLYRSQFKKAQRREWVGSFPLSIEIEASYHCNLRCPYCPRGVGVGERGLGHMDPSLWEKILAEARRYGLKSILMDHEAESLMNPLLPKMVREAKAAGVLDIWLHTNANLLSLKKSEELIDSGLTKINFSIDASKEETYNELRVGGNFQRVIQNVRQFLLLKKKKKANHIRTRVSFVEQKENMGEKKLFFDFWKKQTGLNIIAFQECIDFSPFERPDDEVHLAERELEKRYQGAEPFHCSMPWEMPVIDTEGNVLPCGSPVREHSKDFILGNLNKGDTIHSCWNGAKMKALRTLHEKGEWYKNPMCRVCVKTLRASREVQMDVRRSLLPPPPQKP